jgi:hypothetical protein
MSNKLLTFADLRHYLATHADSPTEISERLQRAADRLAATVAILERTEARAAVCSTLQRVVGS